MAVGAVVARILTQYSDKGSKAAQKDIAKLGKQFDAFAKKTTRAFGIAAAAVGAFAIKVGKDAVQAAIADQKSQALLANSLRNTVGATDAAIASVEGYISKLQTTVGITDDELRPSLARLAAVTSNVADAQTLLGIALDVSAGSGKDLSSVVAAISKAALGNVSALTRLGVPLSQNTIKTKDFKTAMMELNNVFGGAAATRAGTLEYKLKILQIRFGEVLETLGYALLPVVEAFANSLQTDLLPQLEKWIAANQNQLIDGLKSASVAALQLLQAMVAFGKWVAENISLIKNFAIAMATIWATSKVIAFASAIGKVITAMKALRTAGAAAAIATAFATGGTSVVAATAALAAVGGSAAIYLGLKSAGNDARKKAAASSVGGRVPIAGLEKGKISKNTVDVTNKILSLNNKLLNVENKKAKAAKDELTARQKKYNLLLKEMGITTTEQQDAITQFAIRANLLKQAAITGSPLTSIGSPTPMNMAYAGMNNPINVYVQGSVISERDLVKLISDAQKKNTFAGTPVSGTYLGTGSDTLAFKVRYL
jgi:hypothetical protein